jgi:hypothetical protein
MGDRREGGDAVSHIHVIHWSAGPHDRELGYQLHMGWPEGSIVQHILDGQVEGRIERIDWYDVGEDSARDITADVAIACAKRVNAAFFADGSRPSRQVHEFITGACDSAIPEAFDPTFAAA